jgi:hypothetical protein
MKIEFLPVGREPRGWIWKATGETKIVNISGQRFASLDDAIKDARSQLDEDGPDDGGSDPIVA